MCACLPQGRAEVTFWMSNGDMPSVSAPGAPGIDFLNDAVPSSGPWEGHQTEVCNGASTITTSQAGEGGGIRVPIAGFPGHNRRGIGDGACVAPAGPWARQSPLAQKTLDARSVPASLGGVSGSGSQQDCNAIHLGPPPTPLRPDRPVRGVPV